MKVVNVSELKANLSRFLRMASRGERIVVKDRDDPIAQIGPPEPVEATSVRERLSREGRLRLGTQDWGRLEFSKLDRVVGVQASLLEVREDLGEER